jgi:hypothetical protein
MPFLTKYLNGGPIEAIRYVWVPFEWEFPELDVKVLNNSKRTVFLTEAILRVQESRLAPMPVLVVKSDGQRSNALHFFISNEGWGEVRNLRVYYHLTAISDGEMKPVFTEPYPFETAIGDFPESVNVCVADAFRAVGVNLDGLASLALSGAFGMGAAVLQRKKLGTHANEVLPPAAEAIAKTNELLGPFQRGGALVSGELAFEALTEEGTTRAMRVKFSTTVWLYDVALVGAPMPPTFEYAIKLEVDGKSYERRMPISHALKPGEADRFTIKTGMDKSSRHTFRLRLADTEGHELESPTIDLVAFVPRTGRKCEAQTSRPVGSQNDWPPLGWSANSSPSGSPQR